MPAVPLNFFLSPIYYLPTSRRRTPDEKYTGPWNLSSEKCRAQFIVRPDQSRKLTPILLDGLTSGSSRDAQHRAQRIV